MPENTIFSSETAQASSNQQPSQVQPPQDQYIASEPIIEEEPSIGERILASPLLKILGGILVLLIIGFLIVRFVVPMIQNFGASNQKVRLVYWGLWEDPQVVKSMISDFEKENPNITIEYLEQDLKDKYRERLVARTEKGTAPDIFRYHNSWLQAISNILLPLPTSVITPADYETIYVPVIKNDLVKNGAIYGIPLEVDTLSLFTNTTLFTQAGISVPKTWEDFIRAASELTVKDQNGDIQTAGAAMGTYSNIPHASDIISVLFLQNGVDLKSFSNGTAKAATALDFYTKFALPPENVWDDSLEQATASFAKGRLAMHFGYSWDVLTIKAVNKDLAFSVHEVPSLLDRSQTVASYWVEGVSVNTKHQKEAFLFMKYLTRKETLQKLYTESSKTRLFGEPYPQKDLAQSLKDNQFVYPFVAQAQNQHTGSTYFSSDTFDNGLNSQMNKYLENAVLSVLANNTSPQSAAETLAQGVERVLSQYAK